jgi:Tat protein translocase TatB subunit
MNVFGIGPPELLLILVVALIFVGPQRLPRLAADLARTIREIRRYTSGVAAEFNEVVRDLEKETAPAREEWKDIGTGLSETMKDVGSSIQEAQAEAMAPQPPPTPQAASNGASDVSTRPQRVTEAPRPAEEPR